MFLQALPIVTFPPGKTSYEGQTRSMRKRARNTSHYTYTSVAVIYCEILPGLQPFAERELSERFGKRIILLANDKPDAIYCEYRGDLRDLLSLRTVVAVYLALQFAIPRPRALLGHEHYHRLLQAIADVHSLHMGNTFSGLRISAAGGDSPVFAALIEQLCRDTGLPYDDENGDLLLRVRPSALNTGGWEVLIRLTPRPLATRPWRVHNMPGALNATIAAAMIKMTNPRPTGRFLNMMCGSGTLLIERLQQGPAAIAVGCDIDATALIGARKNLEAAQVADRALLCAWDATELPFVANSFNVICADLPWGQLVGSHADNAALYPKMLTEAARLATPSALLILLTHEIALFERILPLFADIWEVQDVVRALQGGLHPRVYVMRKLSHAPDRL